MADSDICVITCLGTAHRT